jgi:hypothetical protein
MSHFALLLPGASEGSASYLPGLTMSWYRRISTLQTEAIPQLATQLPMAPPLGKGPDVTYINVEAIIRTKQHLQCSTSTDSRRRQEQHEASTTEPDSLVVKVAGVLGDAYSPGEKEELRNEEGRCWCKVLVLAGIKPGHLGSRATEAQLAQQVVEEDAEGPQHCPAAVLELGLDIPAAASGLYTCSTCRASLRAAQATTLEEAPKPPL